jgi:hypothetical protein
VCRRPAPRCPTYIDKRQFLKVYGDAAAEVRSAADKTLTVTVPPLSAVVYESAGRIPASQGAPAIMLARPGPSAETQSRMPRPGERGR